VGADPQRSLARFWSGDAPAQELRDQIAAALRSGGAVIEINGRRWRAGAALLRFLEDGLAMIDAGRRLGYVADDELLSPGQAGDLLTVSRPFIYKLIESGELPVAQVRGMHSKIAARDVLAWQQRQSRRADAAEAVAAAAEALLQEREPVKSGRTLAREALATARAGDTAALEQSLQNAAAARVAAAMRGQSAAVAEEAAAPEAKRKTPAKTTKKASAGSQPRTQRATSASGGGVRAQAAASKALPASRSAAAKATGAAASSRSSRAVDTEASTEL
jgi:excisionase family DNA binding protein